MNKRLLGLITILFLTSRLFAQLSIQSQQILMPKKVYIGDTAELRCSFNSDLDLFKQLSKNEGKVLPFEGFTDSLNYKDYDVKSVQFISTGVNYYSLIITFVPWKTGTINLPAYDVVEGFTSGMTPDAKNASSLILRFDPITIVSLTNQSSISTPRGALAPLLLPGTTYKIYGIIFLFVILLIVIIELLIKHEKLATYIRTRKLLRKYKKNKKATVKALSQLKTQEEKTDKAEDKFKAAEIQSIMRKYLEVRFEYPFTKCGASEIMPGFYKATNNLIGGNKEQAAGEIAGVFVRTDFIRYSNNSYGKTKSSFNKNELNSVIDTLLEAIEKLEAVEPEKKDEEGGKE